MFRLQFYNCVTFVCYLNVNVSDMHGLIVVFVNLCVYNYFY